MTPRRAGLAAVAVALALLAPGCAARRAKAEREGAAQFLVAQDVYDRARGELARRNLRKARQTLEKIQYAAEDRTRLEPLVRVALADATFYLGDDLSLIEARAQYQDFVTLYGNHPLAPYAAFQAGVCSAKQIHPPARDQSETRLALADLREVVRRWPESRYALAARDVIAQGEANLAEHEFLVGRFYLQKKKYAAAAERFRRLGETYPRYPAKDKLYFHLGRALHLAASPAEGLAWFDRLFADYPDSTYVAAARKFLDDPPKPETPRPRRGTAAVPPGTAPSVPAPAGTAP